MASIGEPLTMMILALASLYRLVAQSICAGSSPSTKTSDCRIVTKSSGLTVWPARATKIALGVMDVLLDRDRRIVDPLARLARRGDTGDGFGAADARFGTLGEHLAHALDPAVRLECAQPGVDRGRRSASTIGKV
ncbi:hypothetical protein ACVOMT_22550 [Sphingomonas panni]